MRYPLRAGNITSFRYCQKITIFFDFECHFNESPRFRRLRNLILFRQPNKRCIGAVRKTNIDAFFSGSHIPEVYQKCATCQTGCLYKPKRKGRHWRPTLKTETPLRTGKVPSVNRVQKGGRIAGEHECPRQIAQTHATMHICDTRKGRYVFRIFSEHRIIRHGNLHQKEQGVTF